MLFMEVVIAICTILTVALAGTSFHELRKQNDIIFEEQKYQTDLQNFQLFREFIYPALKKELNISTASNFGDFETKISMLTKIMVWRKKIKSKYIIESFDFYLHDGEHKSLNIFINSLVQIYKTEAVQYLESSFEYKIKNSDKFKELVDIIQMQKRKPNFWGIGEIWKTNVNEEQVINKNYDLN